MEWFNIIVTAVCSLIAAVGGGSIIYFKQNRAMKEVEVEVKKQEAESKEIEQWKDLYNEVKSENRRLSEKVDQLYSIQHALQDEVSRLRATLTNYTCTRTNCKNRIYIECANPDIKKQTKKNNAEHNDEQTTH